MQSMTIDSAAIRLTDTILGHDEPDLEQTLKAIAVNIGVLHISYVPARGWRFASSLADLLFQLKVRVVLQNRL